VGGLFSFPKRGSVVSPSCEGWLVFSLPHRWQLLPPTVLPPFFLFLGDGGISFPFRLVPPLFGGKGVFPLRRNLFLWVRARLRPSGFCEAVLSFHVGGLFPPVPRSLVVPFVARGFSFSGERVVFFPFSRLDTTLLLGLKGGRSPCGGWLPLLFRELTALAVVASMQHWILPFFSSRE